MGKCIKVFRRRKTSVAQDAKCILPHLVQFHSNRSQVAGHVESHYSVETGKWSPPVFVEDPFLRIHGMAPGLNYGMQCYEGMKAFRAPNNTINIFRPNKNAERMQHSASFISIPEVPTDHFVACCSMAVGMNAAYVPPHETGAAMYIRPLLFGSSAQLGLNPPQEYTFVVYCIPTGVYHGSNPVDALILEDFDRAAPEGTGSAKVGGNYAPVLRHSEKAYKAGYGITLHLDSKSRSVIDEFSTSAFIGVKKNGDKFKLVASNSKNVIQSVTGDSVLRIAESFGWEAESREVLYAAICSWNVTNNARSPTTSSAHSTKSWLPEPQLLWFPSSPSPCSPEVTSSRTQRPSKNQARHARSSLQLSREFNKARSKTRATGFSR